MSPFEAYVAASAVKRHFMPGSTYDYHRYGGKLNLRASSFEARNDRYYYEKLAKRRDPVGFLVANLSESPKLWVGELFTGEADQRYERWCRVTESITYVLRTELDAFDPWLTFDDLFSFRGGKHPPALEALLGRSFSPETLCVIDQLVDFTPHWERYSWDPVVRGVVHRVRKLRGFVGFDRERVREAIVKIFSPEGRGEGVAA